MKNKWKLNPLLRIFTLFLVLVVLFIGAGIGLFYILFSIPEPEGLSLATWPNRFTDNFSIWMKNGKGTLQIEDIGLERLDEYDLWLQVIDETGQEVFSHNKPENFPAKYTASELMAFSTSDYEDGNTVFVSSFEEDGQTWNYLIGFPYDVGKYMLYYNGEVVGRLKPVFTLSLFGVIFAGSALFLIYGIWLTHQTGKIAKGIGSISRRVYKSIPEKGTFGSVYNCSNYKGNRGTCTSTHYVRVDFLEQVVLGEIRRLTKFASQFEDEFVKAVIGHSQQAEATDRKLKEKELKALQARDEELDGLFERIYEDNVSGKLSDDRFARMSRRYEEEQKELAEKIKALRAEIDKQNSQSMTTDMFISLVRKYTRARKLTPRMLNELIEKIEVFNAEKVDGVWEQRLRIHYNCVGAIEIADLIPLPAPEVSVNTRKGVVVNYAPSTIAG